MGITRGRPRRRRRRRAAKKITAMDENYEMEETMKGNSNERRRVVGREREREREREKRGGGEEKWCNGAKQSGPHGEPIVRKAKGTPKAARTPKPTAEFLKH